MNPSVKDRLASVVRALNGVVLPALPANASLAQEQVMLAMGHIQIILAQMDAAPEFLTAEATDAAKMAQDIVLAAKGGAKTADAKQALQTCLDDPQPVSPESSTARLQNAIDNVLIALSHDGDPVARTAVHALVLDQGAARADKDRRWFAAMGFDIDYSGV